VLALTFGACSDVTLARGLSEREAKDLGAELNRRGVAATQRSDDDGASDHFAIQVAESAVAQAWDAVRDQCSRTQAPPPAAAALLTTREAELRAEEQRLEARISGAIEALPHVHSAAVLITLARSDGSLNDLRRATASTAPRAVVSLVCDARKACPAADHIRGLLSAAVPGLSASNTRILQELKQATEKPCAELGHVGPLTVTRATLPTLKLWFAASLIMHMFGSLALLLLVQRRRRTAKHGR
jgi:type III secretory pathway lipoprotein EscJ